MTVIALSSCATFSSLRPAHTLKKNQFELTGGMAYNPSTYSIVFKGSYGFSDKLEGFLHYETYSGETGLRFNLLPKDHVFAISLGASLGSYSNMLNDILSSSERDSYFGFSPNITFGGKIRKIDVDLYAYYRPQFSSRGIQNHIAKLGGRYTVEEKLFITFEIGSNFVYDSLDKSLYEVFPEGTLGGGFIFN